MEGAYILSDEERKKRLDKRDQGNGNEPRIILPPKFKRRENMEKVNCQLLQKG